MAQAAGATEPTLPTFVLPYEEWSKFIYEYQTNIALDPSPTTANFLDQITPPVDITDPNTMLILPTLTDPLMTLEPTTSEELSIPTMTITPTPTDRKLESAEPTPENAVSNSASSLISGSTSEASLPTPWDLPSDGSLPISDSQINSANMSSPSSNDQHVSPVTIIGVATGGSFALIVSLTVALLFCWRRRKRPRTHNPRASSMSGMQPPEKPPALNGSASRSDTASSMGSKKKLIRWQDEVTSDHSLLLPPVPHQSQHPAYREVPDAASGQQRPRRPSEASNKRPQFLGIPSGPKQPRSPRISYPMPGELSPGKDITIPPHMAVEPSSPLDDTLYFVNTTGNSSLSGPYGRISSAYRAGSMQSYDQRPAASSYYGSMYSCASDTRNTMAMSVYSIFPNDSRCPAPDSFANNPNRQSSIRNSGRVISRCASYTAAPESPRVALSGIFQPNREKPSIAEETDSPSTSSTSSSILNYSPGDVSPGNASGGYEHSSPISSMGESPPSGGLSSPCHPKSSMVETETWEENNPSPGDIERPTTPPQVIGIALSPPAIDGVFDASVPAPLTIKKRKKSVDSDLFLDDTYPDDSSFRHFSCGLPTELRSTESYQTVLDTNTSPLARRSGYGREGFVRGFGSSPPDSPTLPWVAQSDGDLSDVIEGTTLRTTSTRTPRKRDSTYSPTLSMINYYNSPYFSEEDVCAKFLTPITTSPNLHHSKSFTMTSVAEIHDRLIDRSVLSKTQKLRPQSAEVTTPDRKAIVSRMLPLNWTPESLD